MIVWRVGDSSWILFGLGVWAGMLGAVLQGVIGCQGAATPNPSKQKLLYVASSALIIFETALSLRYDADSDID